MDSAGIESNESNPMPHIILNDGGQLQDLESIHGKTIIVKLNDAEDGTAQIFQNYATSISNVEKAGDETEIAFEIIQEPLLNDGGVVDNRLFFESDYQLERTIHQQKENLQIISLERTKEQDHTITKSEENQNSLHTTFTVKECSENKLSNVSGACKGALNTNSVPFSDGNRTSSSADRTVKVKPPDVDENDVGGKNPEVIKKTTVEAFVKMVVCRKITVQKRDAKTGDIIDVDVKMEEEEPVVLGVDYVETTEDVISGNISKQHKDNFKSATASDTSHKILNASVLSEKGKKIGKSIFTNSLLQSALKKKISKVLQSDKNAAQNNDQPESKNLLQTADDKTSKDKSDSECEWMEEFNDNSADYVPYISSKHKQAEDRQRKCHKGFKTSKLGGEIRSASLPVSRLEKEDSDINIPKKRGRKRKWDKTIGLAANMKTCQFCNKHFDSVSSCSNHMKRGNCVSSQFCFICSKTFDSEQELESHISSHRNDNKRSSHNCSDCRRSYRTKAGYVKHFRMGTCKKRDAFEDGETGDFRCEFCDSRFSTVDYLQLHHYKVHENPKDRHVCPKCGKTFYSLQGFQRHRSGRPCTDPLKCHICGKTYKAKESFKLHMKHHKSEITGITFNCDECGRSYMTEAALNKHKLLHTGVKPYKCDVCGKEFAMRYQVKDHARMHNGEKPYSCTICNVSFSNKGHLGRHIRSHENGTLLRRGRPKKLQDPSGSCVEEIDIKLGQTLKTVDGQTIQVINGQIFNTAGDGPASMIIQADPNTIIIAEGWPENAIPVSQAMVSHGDNNDTGS